MTSAVTLHSRTRSREALARCATTGDPIATITSPAE
jgi:hypothetical protein